MSMTLLGILTGHHKSFSVLTYEYPYCFLVFFSFLSGLSQQTGRAVSQTTRMCVQTSRTYRRRAAFQRSLSRKRISYTEPHFADRQTRGLHSFYSLRDRVKMRHLRSQLSTTFRKKNTQLLQRQEGWNILAQTQLVTQIQLVYLYGQLVSQILSKRRRGSRSTS